MKFHAFASIEFLDSGSILYEQSTQQVAELLTVNCGTKMTVGDVYDMYDISDMEELIQYIYTLTNNTIEEQSVYTGVLYYNGKVAVVGMNRDRYVDSYEEMVRILESGL